VSYKVCSTDFLNEKRKEKKRKSGQHGKEKGKRARKEKNMRSREASKREGAIAYCMSMRKA
jgi:hypothetical protein